MCSGYFPQRMKKNFFRNCAVCFCWFPFFYFHPQTILGTSFFTHGGQVEKKETLWKSKRTAQLRKTKSFQGRGMKAKGIQTQNHLWSLGLTQAFFFFTFFLLSSLFLSLSPGNQAEWLLTAITHYSQLSIETVNTFSHLPLRQSFRMTYLLKKIERVKFAFRKYEKTLAGLKMLINRKIFLN